MSVASLWEVSIKVGLGKLRLDFGLAELIEQIQSDGIELLPLSESDLEAYALLPFPHPTHRDPFDRMLVVQSSERGLNLMTADADLASYGAFVELM